MKLKAWIVLPFLATFAACSGGGGGGAVPPAGSLDSQLNKGKELAKLGNAQIHEGYIELLSRVNPNIEGQIKTPAGKKRLVDSLLEQELLFTESMKRGVDKMPEVQEKAALYTRVIYGQALIDSEINKKSQEYYNQNKDKEFARVKLAHILVRPKPPTPAKPPKPGEAPKPVDNSANEAEALKTAQAAKAKLASGAKWGDVVVEYSMDVATKSKNGDLGYISKNDRRAGRLEWDEIIDKAFTMKIGEISEPIKAKDGYHIITVEETASVAPYEEVANSIKFKMRAQVKNEILASLTKGAKTEYTDQELGAAGPAAMSPGQGISVMPQGAPAAAPGAQGPEISATVAPKPPAPAPAPAKPPKPAPH